MATWEECNQAIEKIVPPPSPSPSGGSGAYVVTVSFNENDEPIADKTYDEIVAAIQSGTPVFLSMDGGLALPMPFSEGDTAVRFIGVGDTYDMSPTVHAISVVEVNVNSDNTLLIGGAIVEGH